MFVDPLLIGKCLMDWPFILADSNFQLSNERERAELKELQQSLLEPNKSKMAATGQEPQKTVRQLIITRTFREESEGEFLWTNAAEPNAAEPNAAKPCCRDHLGADGFSESFCSFSLAMSHYVPYYEWDQCKLVLWGFAGSVLFG